jgi:hypothetical protein
MRNEVFVYLEIYSVYLEIYEYGEVVQGVRFPFVGQSESPLPGHSSSLRVIPIATPFNCVGTVTPSLPVQQHGCRQGIG